MCRCAPCSIPDTKAKAAPRCLGAMKSSFETLVCPKQKIPPISGVGKSGTDSQTKQSFKYNNSRYR